MARGIRLSRREIVDLWNCYGQAILDNDWGRRTMQRQCGLPERTATILCRLVKAHGATPPADLDSVFDKSASKPNTARQGVQDEQSDDVRVITYTDNCVHTLPELLEACKVDLDEWLVERHVVNQWQGHTGGRVFPLWQVKAWLVRRYDRLCTPVQAPQRLPRIELPRASEASALFVPDTQHGYRWANNHTRLDPLHDRAAIDAVVRLAEMMQPDIIVFLGDHLDLAPWSTKFARPLDVRGTTTPALWELHWQLAQFRLAAPGAKLVYLEGNHEERITRALTEQLVEATALVPANSDKTAIDVPGLLDLDALDVEYVGPYGEDWWLWDKVRVQHGMTAKRRGGMTVAAAVQELEHHTVFGHVHRVEAASRTLWGPHARREVMALCPGCLCRVEPGVVPAATRRPDWQQGCAVAWRDSRGQVHLQAIPIKDGRLIWAGAELQGTDRSGEIAKACGWPQIDG